MGLRVENRKETPKPSLHVTAGLIRDKGKLLISKRAKGSHLEGFWEFPGGKLENGETLEQCLEREISEELGFRVRAEKALLRASHEYEDRVVILHFFSCEQIGGEPRPIQCEEIRWVAPDELSSYRFPPADKKMISLLIDKRNREAG